MSAGTAVAVINYISQIFTPVESLGMEIQTIQSAIAGVHRINEFFEMDELSVKKDSCIIGNTAMEADSDVIVDFNNVTFAYDDKNVLKNLSFLLRRASRLLCQEEQEREKVQYSSFFLGFTSQVKEAYQLQDRRLRLFRIVKRERYMDMLSRHFIWFRELSKTR